MSERTPADAPLVEYEFRLDPFQTEAIEHLRRGRSVLVAAPTGSGKTVVADHAMAEALAVGERAFYTTPIKALSNQKFRDLVARYGAPTVGLLTGDNSINGDAPLVVMTTEVLRNMIYAGRGGLDSLRYVVLDEVHYLEDTYRGPVWEEVITHLPRHARLVCLSATVSNAREVADWITTVRGRTEAVLEETRPVELVNLFCAGDKTSDRIHLIPTLVNGRPNPEGFRFDGDDRVRRYGRGAPRRPFFTPHRVEVVDRLRDEELFPAIYFIFSRKGCDEAVRTCIAAGVRFTEAHERVRIREIVEARVAGLSDADLAVLGYTEWLAGLEVGIAAHHAGMVPPFKETVEVLFTAGLIRLVFATETLALGVNMPARTVVIEKLTKFTGDHHEFLTAGQYTQLTGRAGRRGIDTLGSAVTLWSPFVTFQQTADLAASRWFVLRSAFRPTYNMAANLVRRYEEEDAHRLLNLSFAQYQADSAVVRLEKRLARRREDAATLARQIGARRTELVAERDASRAAAPVQRVDDALSRLRPGDVIEAPDGAGRAAVLSVAYRKAGSIRVRVVDVEGAVATIGTADLEDPPDLLGSIDLPSPFAPSSRSFQREVAVRLRRMRARRTPRVESVGRNVGRATSHGRTDRAAWRVLEQLERAERDIVELERRVRSSNETLSRRFDDVLAVLRHWGYVEDWALTSRGERLVRIYHECDLAIAEALALGIFDDVDPATLAGLASCFTYEHRSPEPPPVPWFPSRDVRQRAERLRALVDELNALEVARRLPVTRPIDPTFFPLAHAWAAGETLETVLDEEELSGGDFVRNVKQLTDLLGQIADAAEQPATAHAARAAADALQRGVVAASTRVTTPDDETP
ncbi:MAG TPA: DEAD/DEAH box helicase [Acidimicrobiales bacterium]|nr:DEAD/DEAH box helicase [Acidimicrobiales bacterium]